jgi:dUTP pyrophosphatase
MDIKFYFDNEEDYYDLVPQTEGSSGIDLRSNQDMILKSKDFKLVSTGLKVDIPKGYEIQIRPRSGLAFKKGITVLNSPGTIDSDYHGLIGVILINHSDEDFKIFKGDRIAQIVVARTLTTDFRFVDSREGFTSQRGEGGFGSTGK